MSKNASREKNKIKRRKGKTEERKKNKKKTTRRTILQATSSLFVSLSPLISRAHYPSLVSSNVACFLAADVNTQIFLLSYLFHHSRDTLSHTDVAFAMLSTKHSAPDVSLQCAHACAVLTPAPHSLAIVSDHVQENEDDTFLHVYSLRHAPDATKQQRLVT